MPVDQEEGPVPATALGQVVASSRQAKGWSLRRLESVSGIHNAHLSQIENGTIGKPEPSVLWAIAQALTLDYDELLRLAGHLITNGGARRRSLTGAALHALDELSPDEQTQVLHFMDELRKRRNQNET